ncbi:hypothetical protein Tco_0915754 [Tanacetum coccineum]
MREEVLVRSGLSSAWFNNECDSVFRRIDDNAEMSIYDFMTLPSWGDAKVAKESHHLSSPLLERVPSHTTASAAEGAMIPLPTLDEIAASMPDPRLAKKSKGSSQRKLRKRSSEAGSSAPELGQAEGVDEADLTDFCAKIENSLERDEGTYIRATSVPTPRLGKRLGAPPSVVVVSASGSSLVGTSVHASTSGHSLSLGGMVAEVVRRHMDPLDSLAHSALARDAEYDQILKDNFGTTTRGEEIDLTLFSLTPSPYQMSYPYEALDWTITPTKLKRTESLLPLGLSICFNVLSALLVSYGAELNSRCTGCVLKKDVASDKVKELQTELTDVRNELALEKAKSQGYKDVVDGLREEVARFIGFDVESLVQKLLSSDEFYAVLAHIASLSINFGVERGLRMRLSLKQLPKKFLVDFPTTPFPFLGKIGAKADFDKALVDFPTTLFYFLGKVVAASVGTLFEVTQILPDKYSRSVTSAPVAPSITNEDVDQVPFEHASDDLASSI